jgi:hypothetical protein
MSIACLLRMPVLHHKLLLIAGSLVIVSVRSCMHAQTRILGDVHKCDIQQVLRSAHVTIARAKSTCIRNFRRCVNASLLLHSQNHAITASRNMSTFYNTEVVETLQ